MLKPAKIPGKKEGVVYVKTAGGEDVFISYLAVFVRDVTCIPSEVTYTFKDGETEKDIRISVYCKKDNVELYAKSSSEEIKVLDAGSILPPGEFTVRLLRPKSVISNVRGDISLVSAKEDKVVSVIPIMSCPAAQAKLTPALIALGSVRRGLGYTANMSGPKELLDSVEKSIENSPIIENYQLIRKNDERIELHITISGFAPSGMFRIPIMTMTRGESRCCAEILGSVE